MAEVQPTIFKRGQTFSFLMRIPATVSDGFLATWLPKAQLRRNRNNTSEGLIADLTCSWVDSTNHTLLLHHNLTEKWPLGLAELDVKFESASGHVLKSTTSLMEITRGITQ